MAVQVLGCCSEVDPSFVSKAPPRVNKFPIPSYYLFRTIIMRQPSNARARNGKKGCGILAYQYVICSLSHHNSEFHGAVLSHSSKPYNYPQPQLSFHIFSYLVHNCLPFCFKDDLRSTNSRILCHLEKVHFRRRLHHLP
jgi:hypothetical protein